MSTVIQQLATWMVTDAVYQCHELTFHEGDAQIAQEALKRKPTKSEVAEDRKALETWSSLFVKDRNEEEGWTSLSSWVAQSTFWSSGAGKRRKQMTIISFGPVIRHTMGRSEVKKLEVIDKMIAWSNGDTTDFMTDDDFKSMFKDMT